MQIAPVRGSDLLSRAAAAEYIGVKPQTLAVWASTRRYSLPYVKSGRLVKYRRSDLDAWLASRTIGAFRLSRSVSLPPETPRPRRGCQAAEVEAMESRHGLSQGCRMRQPAAS